MDETKPIDEQTSAIHLEAMPSQWEKPARYMAAAFLVVAAALLLSLLIPIFQIVALSFMFAFVFFLPIQKIVSRFPGHHGRVVVISYLLIAVLLALLVYGGLKYFVAGMNNLSVDLDRANASLSVPSGEFPGQILKDVADVSSTLLAGVISLLGRLVQGIGLAVTALILSLMLLLNLHQARGFLADWIPARYQPEIAQLLLNLDRIWVGYIFANVIYGAVVGLGSFVEYRLLGVPYPLVMAVITGVITPIPTIGGLLASLIVAVPCFFLGSSVFVDLPNGTFTLLVYFLNVAITQISYYLVALPVIGRLSRLPTALVFIGVTAGMVTGNILLAFLSVPILSTIVISGKYVLSKILQLDQVPGQEPVESRQPGFFSQLLLAKQG
ncbi:MAG: AI-2E family transporter [Anaerolineales bacterium]|jgi:predicted PurR-regulated permease PerM